MVDSPNSERQKKPDPRTQAEDALASGDLELAIALAEKLSQRKAVGPWDRGTRWYWAASRWLTTMQRKRLIGLSKPGRNCPMKGQS